MTKPIIAARPPAYVLFAGEGEMRARCRDLDWAATPFGPVEDWSYSLRTTVQTLMASRNPMFLWWGPELAQIYNDAYRPSFGLSGRHPSALGMGGRDCWTDIWESIGPEIEQVMAGGEATWHEDQYLPILRNGQLEDVWWTYGYSAVWDDDGTIGGTLVVCQETTQRIVAERERRQLIDANAVAERALRESEGRLRAIFDGTYEYIGLLSPDGILLEANSASLEFAGSTRDEVVGRAFSESVWFASTPGGPDAARDAIARAAAGAFVRFEASLRRPNGEWIAFDISFHPIRDENGTVVYIVPEGRDISAARRTAEERDRLVAALELERSRLAYVFHRAPSFLAILRGPSLVFTLVNEAY